MQSTGVYWIAVFDILEAAGFEVLWLVKTSRAPFPKLVSARQVSSIVRLGPDSWLRGFLHWPRIGKRQAGASGSLRWQYLDLRRFGVAMM
jgi:hypothetical protein